MYTHTHTHIYTHTHIHIYTYRVLCARAPVLGLSFYVSVAFDIRRQPLPPPPHYWHLGRVSRVTHARTHRQPRTCVCMCVYRVSPNPELLCPPLQPTQTHPHTHPHGCVRIGCTLAPSYFVRRRHLLGHRVRVNPTNKRTPTCVCIRFIRTLCRCVCVCVCDLLIFLP